MNIKTNPAFIYPHWQHLGMTVTLTLTWSRWQHKVKYCTTQDSRENNIWPFSFSFWKYFGGISKKEKKKIMYIDSSQLCSVPSLCREPLKSARDTRPVVFKYFCNACQWIGRLLSVSMFALRKYLGRRAFWWRCVTCVWGTLDVGWNHDVSGFTLNDPLERTVCTRNGNKIQWGWILWKEIINVSNLKLK